MTVAPSSHPPGPSSVTAIEPGATLGVLGGGQLGAMFAIAARRLGFRTAVWDPDPDAPALRIADLALAKPFADPSALDEFADHVAAVTYEWENVPAGVAETLAGRRSVRPAARILRTIQHRGVQKTFLTDHGLPVAPFRVVSDPSAIVAAAESVGFPCLCKTATAGYDGKGQWKLESRDAASALERQLMREASPTQQWVIEQFLAFRGEVSVLIARSVDGDVRQYPVAENVHEDGILIMSRVPAALPHDIAARAGIIATRVVEAFEVVGVCCVELFVMDDGRVLVNEVAPRPHNSGHYTLDACTVSQFEQLVRALTGLPLGEARLLQPAAMLNLIGEEYRRAVSGDGLRAIMGTPGAVLHVYGKRTVRARRKMGHITVVRDDAAAAWGSVSTLRRALQRARYAAERA